MEAATERGIGQCIGRLWERQPDDDGFGGCNVPISPVAACVVGLQTWGKKFILTYEEYIILTMALPGDRVTLNNLEGWTFPDFYEYLKDKEVEEEKIKVKADTPVEQLTL